MKEIINGILATLTILCWSAILICGQNDAALPNLRGAEAVRQLKQNGQYDSLKDAFKAARRENIQNPPSEDLVAQTAKFVAADGASFDEFGESVAVSGDTAVIGAPQDDVGANIDQGSAYVFVRFGSIWTQQQKLTSSDGLVDDLFGKSVAISGDTIIIGAVPERNGAQGAAYIFTRSGATWTEQQKLTASDDGIFDEFGSSVAISGDTAIVGSQRNSNRGAAYVFVRSGTVWTEQQKLTASDGGIEDFFGGSVAISGDTVIIGAYFDTIGANSQQGSAYIFVRSGTVWTEQQKLTASDGEADDQFGYSVAISGETAIIGAIYDDIGAVLDQGSGYIFVRSGTNWTENRKLTASDGASEDRFGSSVAISGETVIIGAYGDETNSNVLSQGAAYVFIRSNNAWLEQKITALDGAAGDIFGSSVAVSGNNLIVGAFNDNIGANLGQGSAYNFRFVNGGWIQESLETAMDGAAGDVFGYSVALSGNSAIIGAPDHDVGGNSNQGAAYIFIRSGSGWLEQQKLTAPDGAEGNLFGVSVAISGGTVIVGAADATVNGNAGQGAAYIFVRSGTNWTQQQKLTVSDGEFGDRFGWSSAISGDTVIVGAYADNIGANANQGSAYIFTRSGTIWTHQQQITPSDGSAQDLFGWGIAMTNDTAIIGASQDDVGANEDQGSAYVFIRSGNIWTEQQKLTASDGAESDSFGRSMAISGDTVIAGAFGGNVGANGDQGAAYVFVRAGTIWTEQQKLVAADGTFGDGFGWSVAISGNTAIIGAIYDGVGVNVAQGSAYIFVRSGSSWTEQQQITAADGEAFDQFGVSVAVSDNNLIVGAHFDNVGANTDQGSAYNFRFVNGSWTQESLKTATDGQADDHFGRSVAISGETVIVGAPLDDIGSNINQGSAYIFVRSISGWSLQQKLIITDTETVNLSALSVAISGDTVIISATGTPGAAYIFVRSGTVWTQQQKLTASGGTPLDQFGNSVAISGETAIVGALLRDASQNIIQGGAYVFFRSGTVWTQQQLLTASDGAADDQFGSSLAISGDTVIVGAHQDDVGANGDQGSAYIFVRSGAIWIQQQKLTASDGAIQDFFGYSVAISGETVIVGANFDQIGAIYQGSAYIFVRSGTNWTQQEKIIVSDGAAEDQFGFSVAIFGETAIVGAISDNVGANIDQGSAYIFERTGTNWRQKQKITASAGGANDNFGYSVGISGEYIIVGSPFSDASVSNPIAGGRQRSLVPNATDQGAIILFGNAPLAPTAANVSIGGRVLTASGGGLPNAIVSLTLQNGTIRTARTNSFGYYNFDNIIAGQTVVVAVTFKRYQIASQVLSVNDNVTDLVFIVD